jgi:hypothetical protein
VAWDLKLAASVAMFLTSEEKGMPILSGLVCGDRW